MISYWHQLDVRNVQATAPIRNLRVLQWIDRTQNGEINLGISALKYILIFAAKYANTIAYTHRKIIMELCRRTETLGVQLSILDRNGTKNQSKVAFQVAEELSVCVRCLYNRLIFCLFVTSGELFCDIYDAGTSFKREILRKSREVKVARKLTMRTRRLKLAEDIKRGRTFRDCTQHLFDFKEAVVDTCEQIINIGNCPSEFVMNKIGRYAKEMKLATEACLDAALDLSQNKTRCSRSHFLNCFGAFRSSLYILTAFIEEFLNLETAAMVYKKELSLKTLS